MNSSGSLFSLILLRLIRAKAVWAGLGGRVGRTSLLFSALCAALLADTGSSLAGKPVAADFALFSGKSAATLCVETTTDAAVARAAGDLAADIERVTNHKPAVVNDAAALSGDVVIAGVL